ncbi:hypothetical protein CPB85DRAFT_994384 [Mucidula mucida]|nr:hypothetical protein CPB85DRAFT_994384 [Mucidula mucida]
MNCPHCGTNPLTLAPPIKCVTDRTPRLDALFASNEPPLDTDVPMLQQKHAQARAESADLDSRMAAVRAVLDGLLAQQATVNGYAEQIKAISHPVRTLPTDVLGEIFFSFVKDVMYPPFDHFRCGSFVDSLDVRKGPCVLTHVSSGWRRTALGLPRLWSCIQLKSDCPERHARASFLQNILSRSLNLPLHITLYASNYNISDYGEFSVLLGTSNRWQSAALALSYSTFLALNSRIALDALQTVWINLGRLIRDPVPQNQIRILEHAPRLRSLAVHNDSEFLTNFTVAWSQITHFTGFKTMSLEAFVHSFRKLSTFVMQAFQTISIPRSTADMMCREACQISHVWKWRLLRRQTYF